MAMSNNSAHIIIVIAPSGSVYAKICCITRIRSEGAIDLLNKLHVGFHQSRDPDKQNQLLLSSSHHMFGVVMHVQ